MKLSVIVLFLLASIQAVAANPLSSSQLLKAAGVALQEYSSAEPDMSQSISGVRSTTVGKNAVVTIEMNADGMKMSAKYLCVVNADDVACNLQQ